MRGFLQRCEVRLSTMHRVATALLSGAGILVLLPAVERDAVLEVLRSLLVGPISWSRGLLAAAVTLSIVLALAVLWLVIVELTRFYFHSNHVVYAGQEVFTPRFTLTGLRLPAGELEPTSDAAYTAVHESPQTARLLVPANDRSRRQVDRQLRGYGGLAASVEAAEGEQAADVARAAALFELAAARRRPLVEEVNKVEYGIVRHMLRLQVIVLRYVKALLVVVLTAVAAFACAAAVNSQARITAADERWIAGAMLLWAPAVMMMASAPVRWLDTLLRSEGATRHAASRDPELTQLEDITARVAVLTWLLAGVAMVLLLVHHPVSHQGAVATVVVMVGSVAGFVFAFGSRWAIRHHRDD